MADLITDPDAFESGGHNKKYEDIGDDAFAEVVSTQPAAGSTGSKADTATLSNVNDSDSNQTLLAANPDRLGVIVVNDSTATLFLKYGVTASATSFTYKIGPGSTWEMPGVVYTGIIDGIWDANAAGAARCTELT